MNNSMFLPQIAEDDQYDKNGMQVDDINSVSEYVNQVILGNTDTTPEDEDNDDGQNFHVIKTFEYRYQQAFTIITQTPVELVKTKTFSEYRIPTLSTVSFDIITPPPDQQLITA